MNIMTALRETYELWEELAIIGGSKTRTIEDDPDRFEHIRDYVGCCPCCEYTAQILDSKDMNCAYCPVWDKEDKCSAISEYGGEYVFWLEATPLSKEKKYWAKKIANMAKENYDFLASLGYKEEGKD